MHDAIEKLPGGLVTVTPAELEHAIAVWLKVMPKHLWRDYERMLQIDPKRLNQEDRVDPRQVLAAYLCGEFERANWSTSYVKSGGHSTAPRQ